MKEIKIYVSLLIFLILFAGIYSHLVGLKIGEKVGESRYVNEIFEGAGQNRNSIHQFYTIENKYNERFFLISEQQLKLFNINVGYNKTKQ